MTDAFNSPPPFKNKKISNASFFKKSIDLLKQVPFSPPLKNKSLNLNKHIFVCLTSNYLLNKQTYQKKKRVEELTSFTEFKLIVIKITP